MDIANWRVVVRVWKVFIWIVTKKLSWLESWFGYWSLDLCGSFSEMVRLHLLNVDLLIYWPSFIPLSLAWASRVSTLKESVSVLITAKWRLTVWSLFFLGNGSRLNKRRWSRSVFGCWLASLSQRLRLHSYASFYLDWWPLGMVIFPRPWASSRTWSEIRVSSSNLGRFWPHRLFIGVHWLNWLWLLIWPRQATSLRWLHSLN